MPTDAPGLSTGYVQPEATNEARIGTRQPSETLAGTGTQIYDGATSFRGYWPYQLGFSASAYDDPFNQAFLGNDENFTPGSLGFDAKYSLIESDRYAAAVEVSVTYLKYGFDDAEKEGLFGATLSLPATYRLTARLFVYGSAKALFREDDDGIEGDEDAILTLGARYALTPQLAATVYVTNGYADTPVFDDVGLFVAPDEMAFGAALTFIPSGKRFNIPRYDATPVPAGDREIVFGDGITLMGPQTIGSNELRLELGGGTSGNARLAGYLSPDPDFQIEVVFEDYALEEAEAFRDEGVEDTRYSVGARYQALSETEGDPVSLGGRVLFGRDIDEPTVGVLFAEAALRKDLGPRAELTLNPKVAAYGDDEIHAAGLGLGYDLSERLQLVGEASYVGGDADEPVYAMGLRHAFPEALSAIDIYATNASGRSGVGSMLAGEPQIGVTFTWQTPIRAF